MNVPKEKRRKDTSQQFNDLVLHFYTFLARKLPPQEIRVDSVRPCKPRMQPPMGS